MGVCVTSFSSHLKVSQRLVVRGGGEREPFIYAARIFRSLGSASLYQRLSTSLEPRNRPTFGRMTMKSTRRVLGQSLLHSFVRSHRSFIYLLRTARFARALRCAHSSARSLAHSVSGAHGNEIYVFRRNASISYNLKPLCMG